MELVKTKEELKIMRKAGSILAKIMRQVSSEAQIGVSTGELDKIAEDLCKQNNVRSAFKGYDGFPSVLCTGIDDVAVHGIPSKNELLLEGMILSIDMGIEYHGYFSDHAVTIPIGKVDESATKLMETTKLALTSAIETAKAGNYVGDIGNAIDSVATIAGLEVIRQMTGHGIGKNLHEEPQIPCFGEPKTGMKLKKNMTLALEPMINEGGWQLRFLEDGWTTKTLDGSRSAIFEHTIVVGKKKGEIITI